jgi:hypothetical protein
MLQFSKKYRACGGFNGRCYLLVNTLLNNTRHCFLAIYAESNILIHDGLQ